MTSCSFRVTSDALLFIHAFCSLLKASSRKLKKHTKNTCNIHANNIFDVSTDHLKESLWRNDVWNTHTHADTHTHTLCWQCVLWVPGSSRGLSCCLDIWLLRQIWLIWDGQESSVQQRTDCTRTSPLVRPPPHTVPGLHPRWLKTDQSSGIQMV